MVWNGAANCPVEKGLLGLQSTLIRQIKTKLFENALQTLAWNLKTPELRFGVDRKNILKTAFQCIVLTFVTFS